MGDGRFGPVFRARDGAGVPVIVRTFAQAFSAGQRDRFVSALEALCAAPLEHPSIARPVAYGLDADGRPYVVHAFLPGTPLTDLAAASGRRDVDDSINRLTYVAGALDFAAAAGVLHGALSRADVIFSSESAGVSGLGLVQALDAAGLEGFHARREDDVAALMRMAQELLGDRTTPAASSILTGAPLPTALEFAAALRRTVLNEPPMPEADPVVGESHLLVADDFLPESLRPDLEVDTPEAPFDSEIEAAGDHLIDVQLRRDEEQLEAPAMFGSSGVSAVPPRRRGSLGWIALLAGALALGIFTGFAGGFFVGREAPVASAPADVRREAAPEATSGQNYTDAPVTGPAAPSAAAAPAPDVQSPSESSAAVPRVPAQTDSSATQEPAGRGDTAPRTPAGAASPSPARRTPPVPAESVVRSGPAAVRVESNPAGAQVFVDGRSVGYAPLVVGELTPGTHSIRMQLPGYRPWVSALTLGPGARERVAASLEQ
jgi:hypothetical protein